MRKILLFILCFGCISPTLAKICDSTSIVQSRNGILFLPNQVQPFSGENLCIYENGQYQIQGEYTDGLKDGEWVTWSENGIKKTELIYMLGSLKTKTVFSAEHYQKVLQINYTNGNEVSKIFWIYFDNGIPEKEVGVVEDKRNGRYISWYDNGNKEYQGNFVDGVAQGVWTHWHKNGKKEEVVEMLNNERSGTSNQWDEDGLKLEDVGYKNGKLHGLWRKWHKNGQKKEIDIMRKALRLDWRPVGTRMEKYMSKEVMN